MPSPLLRALLLLLALPFTTLSLSVLPHSTPEIKELSPVLDFSIRGQIDGDHRHLSAYEEGEPHFRVRGNVEQPYPDAIALSFRALDETFDYELTVVHSLFPDDAVITLSGDGGDDSTSSATERTAFPRLTSYETYFEGGFATATILFDGTVHALIYRDNELFQVDAIRAHEGSLGPEKARALRDEAPHGMVAFRRSERIVPAEKASCGHPVDDRCPERGEQEENGHDHDVLHSHGIESPDAGIHAFLSSSSPVHSRKLGNAVDGGDPAQWTDCYTNDSVARKLAMGIATDRLFYTMHGSSEAKAQETIASVVADSNSIYVFQLNIFLQVAQFYMKTASGGEAWNNAASDTGGTCSQTIESKLDAMRAWSTPGGGRPNERGLWHLLTPCFYSGTVGLAYVGVLCSTSGGYNTGVSGHALGNCCSDWGTFAHEVGHNFGGGHSFEDGKGSTGGIMD
jgi:hypothetical protein